MDTILPLQPTMPPGALPRVLLAGGTGLVGGHLLRMLVTDPGVGPVTMLSRGRILAVALVSLVYGVTVAVGTVLQLTSLNIPTDLVTMLPYIVVMVVLLIFGRSVYISPVLGAPYTRGAR